MEKKRALIDIAACKRTGESFPHTLIYGQGGLGKTTFARAIAYELNYHFVEKEAASFRHRKDIVEFLVESDKAARRREKRLLMFVDECHRFTVLKQEVFYFPMSDLKVDVGNDTWYKFSPFTLFMATTQPERLDRNSFVTRFDNEWELKPHHPIIMEQILQSMFAEVGIRCGSQEMRRLATICSGIPRTARTLVNKLRRYVIAHNRLVVTNSDLDKVLAMN